MSREKAPIFVNKRKRKRIPYTIIEKYLYIHGKYANIQGKRCSILVGVAIFQEGPKNPLKGTSMKSLVFACYAQFRVDAGG